MSLSTEEKLIVLLEAIEKTEANTSSLAKQAAHSVSTAQSLEKAFAKTLEKIEKNTADAVRTCIHAERKNNEKSVLKKYALLVCFTMLCASSLYAFSAHSLAKEKEALAHIQKQKQEAYASLQLYKEQSQNWTLSMCDGRPCIQIDESAPQYTNSFRVIK